MLASGDNVDAYVVLEPIGAGGQATVWRARERASGAIVALKLVSLTGVERTDTRAKREAQVLASLVHPSLVRCHRFFEDGRRRVLGLVLEWVDGTTLDRARADPRWSPAHTQAALVHVAAALAKLHEAGVVHRDVKGRNVLVSDAFFESPSDPSTVKLADLGIATGVGNPAALTSLGFLVGTPRFMPPETLRNRGHQDARPSRDVFALGVMGWLLVHDAHPTGLPTDATLDELLAAYDEYREADALWLPDAETDDAVTRALRRCLRLTSEKRPADARAALELLPTLPRHSVPKTSPSRPTPTPEPVPQQPSPPQQAMPREPVPQQPHYPQPPQPSVVIRPQPTRPGDEELPAPTSRMGTNRSRAVGVAALVAALGCVAILIAHLASRNTLAQDESAPEVDGTIVLPKRSPSHVRLSISADTPKGALGEYHRIRSCAPNWPAPPTLEELTQAEARDTPLEPAQFRDDDCEAEVVESSSHCALTHRVGRWLRLRFYLRGGTHVTAVSSDLEPVATPWPGGVDLFVPLPPRRATVEISADGLWEGAHELVLDPAAAKPMGFGVRGPCR